MKFLLLGGIVVVVCGVSGWLLLREKTPARIMWQGYADADFVKVGPTQQGLVVAVHVARGDRVEKDHPLFEQDDADDKAAVTQAQSTLQQARDQLANLQNPGKPTEIAEAEANLHDAQSTRDKDKSDLDRNQTLLKTGAATAQLVEQEQEDLRSATAKTSAMQALLDQSKASMGRRGEITAQFAAVDAAAAALVQAQWRLSQTSVVAPATGVIADVLARPGETLAAGAPVVSLLPPANIFVRFFVPESQFSTLHMGDTVALACDNCASDMTATISFISPQAEYTPPFIYSEATSSKFVFLAQATPTASEATRLNPGEPVTVTPKVAK
jgi:HlyD family secretion protein